MDIDVTGYTDVDLPDDVFLAITVYSEAGGTYKTTTTVNLAKALERKGLNVLVTDLDPQEGCLSYLFDLVDEKADPDADNLVWHVINQPKGDFEDLIRESGEGFDVLPSHDKLLEFNAQLQDMEAMADRMGGEFNKYDKLQQVFAKNDVPQEYDVLLIDPQATPSAKLYNAIYATRTLLSPVEPSGKGSLSLDGLEGLVAGMEQRLDIGIGVAGVVPMNVGSTNASENYREQVEASQWDVPAVIGKRESLMAEMWDAQGSAYTVLEGEWKEGEAGTRTVRERELETLAKFDCLADHVIDQYVPVDKAEATA